MSAVTHSPRQLAAAAAVLLALAALATFSLWGMRPAPATTSAAPATTTTPATPARERESGND